MNYRIKRNKRYEHTSQATKSFFLNLSMNVKQSLQNGWAQQSF